MGVVQGMKGCWPPRKVLGVWWFGVLHSHYLVEDFHLYNVTDMIACS